MAYNPAVQILVIDHFALVISTTYQRFRHVSFLNDYEKLSSKDWGDWGDGGELCRRLF